jgi:protein involved in polysaccharide export with SLBB domain
MRNHYLLFLLFFILISSTLVAQVDQATQGLLKAQLAAKGVSEEEMRAKLQEKGIDIDNVQPSQLPTLQPTIEKILAEIEAEKAGTKSNAAPVLVDVPDAITVEPTAAMIEQKKAVGITIAEKASEQLSEKNIQLLAPTEIYGHHLFREKDIAIFRTTNEVKPPDTYVLGTGDEITISIFGPSSFDSKFTINKEGFISPTGMPKIFLKGVRLGQAKELIKNRFSSHYRFAPEQFVANLTTARTISVNIFGESNNVGTFIVSAINTAFNALVAAGGPTELGTVRKIKVIRDGKSKELDIYNFINDPKIQYEFFLEDNDIIHIPASERIVTLDGAIRRPFKYELIEGEQWNKLLEYAGGFQANAFREVIQIKRFKDDKQVLIDVNLKDLKSGNSDYNLINGDHVIVKTISTGIENTASIEGPLDYPGTYSLTETPRLSDLLKKAVLRKEARTDIAFLARTNNNGTINLIQIDVNSVMINQGGSLDLVLQAQDRLVLYAQSRYTDTYVISVEGAVRNAIGKYPYSPDSTITLEKAILLAGGLRPDANGLGYLQRTNINNNKEKEYIEVSLKNAIESPNSKENLKLQPGDVLYVISELAFTDDFSIAISGSVRSPGEFAYGKNMTLRNALILAGGFKLEASRSRIDIYRVVQQDDKPTRAVVATVEVDEKFNMLNTTDGEVELKPFDEIVVRVTPDFEFQQYVSVNGEVKYPGKYALLSDNETLIDLINRAGGLTREAFASGATLYRTEKSKGFVVTDLPAVLKSRNSNSNHILKAGDKITIPKSEDLVTILTTNTDALKILLPELLNEGKINVAFSSGKRAGWYIRKYSAGFADNANKNQVHVTQPNGKINRTINLGLFKIYPKVTKGSIIMVGSKAVKENKTDKKEKEKSNIDWDKKLSQILAVSSTLATMLLSISVLR